MVPTVTQGAPVRVTSVEEGRALLERMSQELLGLSGDDFVAAWERGEYRDTDNPDVARLSMLLPFAR